MKDNYYIGLDIGTNSVGYAVTDKSYNLLKYKGEPMWGSHVFEEGNQSADRRSFRSARRRLNRRQQRIHLTQEIFAKAIGEIDSRFFIRLKESALFREDTSGNDTFVLFQDENYTDKDFYKEYPTIHHLILKLMESDEPTDVRLVYIAVAWLMAHRGHFLSNVDKEKVSDLLEFDPIYDNFMDFFEETPWVLDDKEEFKRILTENQTIGKKEEKFKKLLFDGKMPKDQEEDFISKKAIIKLLSGGTIDASKIFIQDDFEEKVSISLSKSEEDFALVLSELDEEQAEFLIRIRALYDWASLVLTLNNCSSISEAKVFDYNQHKEDLRNLKYIVHKYCEESFKEIFIEQIPNNYAAYAYNIPKHKREKSYKKATTQEFCDFLKKKLKDISCDEEDIDMYNDMMLRIETYTFMPKQVRGDNRVIPYQLYYYELKKILDNSEKYLSFLTEVDDSGVSNKDKLLSIFTFRIPYFVGPLCEASDFAWLKRKAEGKIYPWNFEEMVDFDRSEDEFINRMTNTCTYLPGETVLPANSLLYKKFSVLNEINNIKINGNEISPKCKQEIYRLFEEKGNKNVTVAKVKNSLISNGYMTADDTLSGIDIKINSNLKSFHDFYRLLKSKTLSERDVEKIIEIITYSEDKSRIIKRVEREFPDLSKEDVKYISKLKYKGFGRLSRKFLTEIEGVNKETGECYNIINTLWETNDNLMQILSSNYTFEEELKKLQKDYYTENPKDIESILDDMYISNAVKRPIYRTLDVVKDIKSVCKNVPDKIFIEMARGEDPEKKRTVSRKEKIKEYYKNFAKEQVRELQKQLETFEERELRDEKLYLYFMQLGRSMYSGKVIDIERLNTKVYDIDHIYPQSKVKDDSFSNKVLVLSEENGAKGDKYPINSEIREKMTPMWRIYQKNGLITEEKYKRLTRMTPFTEKECLDFINRQLVETRQSTKAITRILQFIFPETEIVFVKAKLASDFRNEILKVMKSRSINDLHHAKDAYLNVVVGDVYNARFTQKFFNVDQKYSVNLKAVFGHDVYRGKEKIWNGEDDILRIKKIHSKNNIHYTRFAFERKGGLFDQNPVRASEGLTEIKAGLDTKKYGGYNKPTATYYLLAKYTLNEKKQEQDIMFVPVELMASERIKKDEAYLPEYVRSTIAKIIGKDEDKVQDISFPIGTRKIKINTILSLDGFLVAISGKASGGKQIGLCQMLPLKTNLEKEEYIKHLESFSKKSQQIKSLKVDSKYDKITKEENILLYDFFVEKLSSKPFDIIFSGQIDTLVNGKNKFEQLAIEKQVEALLNILSIFKTGRAKGCDLSLLGGKSAAAVLIGSSKLSNLKKHYKNIQIIDVSPAGLHMKKSENLLELI